MLANQHVLPNALQSYREGWAITGRLAKSDPSNTDWQDDLSRSYERIANTLID
jgi:hypothetical protein